MRTTGTTSRGVRLPIISPGDDLVNITADCVVNASKNDGFDILPTDIIGITEAIVAKSQNNYATTEQLAADVAAKFPEGEVGVCFPILSRNRFFNILKGIAQGAKKVYVLLCYPNDEVGNPIVDWEKLDDVETDKTLFSGEEFKALYGEYLHPFTFVDYIELYKSAGDNVEVYLSKDPRDILKLTPYVIEAEIHLRHRTTKRLLKAGAKRVFSLADLLSAPVDGSGYNENYGVLGSNLSTSNKLKLFPRDCASFVEAVRAAIEKRTGVSPEVLIYGDGAFKDPYAGIWELADPVVSPAHTARLGGMPNEIKLKYVADNQFGAMSSEDKQAAVTDMIRNKTANTAFSEGTTPRKYADLIGSLCDLMSGSGDKGTPVIYIKGYFDDYAAE